MKRVTITTLIIAFFLILGTLFATFYARGYRIVPEKGETRLQGTGLLVVTSKPDGAKVFLDDQMLTATDNTVNLYPGEYFIKITKEGYFSWSKKITIKKEEVARADALLVPIAPRLESLTFTGAANPAIDPAGSLITYTVSSISAQKNGIYILDMNARTLLNPTGSIKQIANDILNRFSETVSFEFSPDNDEIITSIDSVSGKNHFLLSTKEFNGQPKNINLSVTQTQSLWQEEKDEKLNKTINDNKKALSSFIKQNFKHAVFSPEKNKILYEASASAVMPEIIKPRLVGTNSTPEERNLKEGNIYVYDIREDRNYLIFNTQTGKNSAPEYTWHPDSAHLIFSVDRKINIMDFDGQNAITVYAGPFLKSFVHPWPDGSGIVILTNLNNENAPNNLYKISLK